MTLIGLKFSFLFSLKCDMIAFNVFNVHQTHSLPISDHATTTNGYPMKSCVESVSMFWNRLHMIKTGFVHLTRNLESLAYHINIDVLRYIEAVNILWSEFRFLIIFIQKICSIMT